MIPKRNEDRSVLTPGSALEPCDALEKAVPHENPRALHLENVRGGTSGSESLRSLIDGRFDIFLEASGARFQFCSVHRSPWQPLHSVCRPRETIPGNSATKIFGDLRY